MDDGFLPFTSFHTTSLFLNFPKKFGMRKRERCVLQSLTVHDDADILRVSYRHGQANLIFALRACTNIFEEFSNQFNGELYT